MSGFTYVARGRSAHAHSLLPIHALLYAVRVGADEPRDPVLRVVPSQCGSVLNLHEELLNHAAKSVMIICIFTYYERLSTRVYSLALTTLVVLIFCVLH